MFTSVSLWAQTSPALAHCQQLLNLPNVMTDFGRRAFSYCAPKIWNEVPAAIRKMLQLCKLSNTGSKPTCLVLWTILKHDPTSHLATARASDSVIYSDIALVISLYVILLYYLLVWRWHVLQGHRGWRHWTEENTYDFLLVFCGNFDCIYRFCTTVDFMPKWRCWATMTAKFKAWQRSSIHITPKMGSSWDSAKIYLR